MNRFTNFYLFIIVTLFICPLCIASAQSHPVSDSLFAILEENPNDTSAYFGLNEIINELYYTDSDLAMEIALTELDYATKAGNNFAKGKAILNIGILYDIIGVYDSAIVHYKEALKIAEQYNLINLQGDIYNNSSITNAVLGNMEQSISCAFKALAIFEKTNDSTRMAKIFNSLGARYSELSYHDEALEYYHKAANINEQLDDKKRLAYNYGNIGLLYYDLDEGEMALEYFQKSMQLQDTINDKYNFSIALHNLSLAYQLLHKFDMALPYEKQAYTLACEVNDELGKITIIKGLATIHKGLGEKRKALEYFHQAEKMAEEMGARYYLIETYESIAELYAEFKDYQNAFLYNQKHSSLSDSILTTERDKATQKIKEFDAKKKQQEIQLLTKDSEIQKLNIKRQKTIRNSVSVLGILILIMAIGLFHRYRFVRKTRNELSEKNIIINKEKERSDELLLNILPAETAEELKNTGHSDARHFDMVSVMFTDFKGFTFMAEQLPPKELVSEIDHCFKNFDQIVSKYNIEKIKTIGDAYMCAGGLPSPNDTNPEDVVKAALEIQAFMQELKKQKKAENKPYFELRLGINTGPVVAGIVGTKKFQYDIWGDTVNIASRMESSGEVGKVNISQMTYEKVKDKFICEHRGKVEAKNKGAIDMYFIEGEKTG